MQQNISVWSLTLCIIVWKLLPHIEFMKTSQSCSACCPVFEDPCFIYFACFSLYFFFKEGKSSLCILSCFSCVQLFVTLWTIARPGSSVHGILQARILEWVAMPSSRGSSWPRNEPASLMFLAIAGRFFTTSTTCKALSFSKETLIHLEAFGYLTSFSIINTSTLCRHLAKSYKLYLGGSKNCLTWVMAFTIKRRKGDTQKTSSVS